jgi:RND family efflux transporter MFP subunit
VRNFGLALVAIMVAFGVSGCVDRKGQKAAKDTSEIVNDPLRDVAVTTAKVEDIQELLQVNGEIVTSDDAQISAQVAGKIRAVYIKDGDTVSQGQVVATMDSENLEQQAMQARASLASAMAQLSQASANARLTPSRSSAAVRQAEATLRSAKSQLQKSLNGARPEEREQAENNVRAAKSNFETAKKNLERVRLLVKEGALAGSQLDTALNTYESTMTQYENSVQALKLIQNSVRPEDIQTAREQVRQAEQALESAKSSKRLDVVLLDQVNGARAQVNSARAQVQVAEKNLRDASIRAPFSGRIYGRPLQAGVVVGSGTPIARLVGGSGVYFEGQAPSDKIGLIREGTSVSVSVDGMPGSTFPGKVVSISPQGDSVGRLFNVRIQFAQVSTGIRPGMFANGSVVLNENKGALMVSEESIISRDGIKYIMAVEGVGDSKKAKKIVVTTGIKKGAMVEVKGISSATQVISKGQGALVDGTKVRVAAPNKGV